LVAKPRTSRTVSAEPRSPTTVEKRTNTGVFTDGSLQEGGLGIFRHRLVDLEIAVRARAAGVHDPLGDALVVKVGHLLTEVEIFHEGRAALAGRQRIVGVVDAHALVGGQVFAEIRVPAGFRGVKRSYIDLTEDGMLPQRQ
jgi:hypothetical protein